MHKQLYTTSHLTTQGRRWGGCEDLSLIDAEGVELLLIGARHEPPKGIIKIFVCYF